MISLVLLALLGAGPEPRCAEELCRFGIKNLRLVALVTGDKNPVAMFEGPDEKGMIARVKSRIGKLDGRVISMSDACVTVLELGEKLHICVGGEPRVLWAR